MGYNNIFKRFRCIISGHAPTSYGSCRRCHRSMDGSDFNFLCLFRHDWSPYGCSCFRCGRKRDHDWKACTCKRCKAKRKHILVESPGRWCWCGTLCESSKTGFVCPKHGLVFTDIPTEEYETLPADLNQPLLKRDQSTRSDPSPCKCQRCGETVHTLWDIPLQSETKISRPGFGLGAVTFIEQWCCCMNCGSVIKRTVS